ncbi:MAG: hypothetical protein ACUVRG_12065, partial [Ignavibacterium sp.]|uniref:hypothetical protein n=1 Tax=Ignavibacterium sp. TaxID=2651167 RepID=UPI00404B8414
MKLLITIFLYIFLLFTNANFSQSLWNLSVTDQLIACVGGDTSISTLHSIMETDSLKNDIIYGCAAELLAIYWGDSEKNYILDKLKHWINKNEPSFSWIKYFQYQRIAGFLGDNSAISGMDTIIYFSKDIFLRKNAIGYLAEANYFEYYDTVKSYFLNQNLSNDGILLFGEYGRDERYKNEVKLFLSKIIQDSTDSFKVYLAAVGLSKFDSAYAFQLLDNRFRNSNGVFRRDLFKYLGFLDPNNQMERSKWVIPQESDEFLRSDYIPLIYSDSSFYGAKEYLSPSWIKFMENWLNYETSKLIRVILVLNVKEFIPQRINTNLPIEENINSLNDLVDSINNFNWLGDLDFYGELKSIITTAKTQLQNG